jgi:myo-inositol-1(or 4)-monophosphatase
MKLIDPAHLLEIAEEAARLSGKMIMQAKDSEIVINESHHHDLKIQLDIESQKLLTHIILENFPDHTILGEEGGQGNEGKGYEWIIDPIDGTVNFVYGIPHYCISLACRLEGVTQIGVIYDPNRDECFKAIKNGGATCNGKPIRVSSRTQLNEAILALGFSKGQDSIDKCIELYRYYASQARKLRAMGSAALDMAYVASGRLDAYIEQGIKIWDIAAGQLLIEEAGGKVILTSKDNIPHNYSVCAWNGLLELEKL